MIIRCGYTNPDYELYLLPHQYLYQHLYSGTKYWHQESYLAGTRRPTIFHYRCLVFYELTIIQAVILHIQAVIARQ